MKRRDFLKSTATACCGAIIINSYLEKVLANNSFDKYGSEASLRNFLSFSDDDFKRMSDIALSTSRSGGASYADIRICKNRNQRISTREDKIQSISDGDDIGFGVRVLINGTWGFASSAFVNDEEIIKTSKLACDIAKANSVLQKKPVELTYVPSYNDTWRTPVKVNPFDIPISEKVELQFKWNKLAKEHGANFVDSFMWFVNEWKYFASTEDSYIKQEIYRMWTEVEPTVIDKETGKFESRKTLTPPIGKGYEFIQEFPFETEIATAVEHAKMKLKAPSVEPGKRTIVLDQQNLWLTIHESCGHPTELDRALGYEANYAGTSFMTPDKLNNLQYGSELVNMVADRTQKDGLATRGYDDDGVKTSEWHLVKNGRFVNYQTTREFAPFVGREDSFACAYADSWSHFPIMRMPNVSLQPGKDKLSFEDLIADTDDGILIIGENSWSIDMQRYNFQFTGQEFWEIKNGKKLGMLNDVAYQGNTVNFWNSMDAICDESEYQLGGSFFCGKGEPGQVSPVSHGSSPARFRNINILNTKQQI
jgi:TldD protein